MNTKMAWTLMILLASASVTPAWLAANPKLLPAQSSESWIPTSHFSLEIEGIGSGEFWFLEGLSSELEVLTLRTGNERMPSQKTAGELSVAIDGITIRGPFSNANAPLREWLQGWQSGSGRVTRDAIIRVRNPDQSDALVVRLRGTWPSTYSLSRLGVGQTLQGTLAPQGILQETFVLQTSQVLLETP